MRYKKLTVSHPITGEHFQVQEHVMIWLLNKGLWQKGIVTIEAGWYVHHVDFNPHNNDPSNLLLLSSKQHSQLHWDHDAPRRKRVSDSLKKSWDNMNADERKARTEKMRIAAAEKVKREGYTDAQKENIKKARAAAYGGTRFKS
jgi:hypothetical protein